MVLDERDDSVGAAGAVAGDVGLRAVLEEEFRLVVLVLGQGDSQDGDAGVVFDAGVGAVVRSKLVILGRSCLMPSRMLGLPVWLSPFGSAPRERRRRVTTTFPADTANEMRESP